MRRARPGGLRAARAPTHASRAEGRRRPRAGRAAKTAPGGAPARRRRASGPPPGREEVDNGRPDTLGPPSATLGGESPCPPRLRSRRPPRDRKPRRPPRHRRPRAPGSGGPRSWSWPSVRPFGSTASSAPCPWPPPPLPSTPSSGAAGAVVAPRLPGSGDGLGSSRAGRCAGRRAVAPGRGRAPPRPHGGAPGGARRSAVGTGSGGTSTTASAAPGRVPAPGVPPRFPPATGDRWRRARAGLSRLVEAHQPCYDPPATAYGPRVPGTEADRPPRGNGDRSVAFGAGAGGAACRA